MDWSTMKSGLKTLVASMCGLSNSPGAVEWQDAPAAAAWRPSPRVTLFARSVVGRGQDGKRLGRNAGNTADEAVIVGARSFTLVAKVESESDSDDARIYADRIRTRLRRDSSRSALRAMNLSFVQVLSTVDQSLVTQGRKLSVCVTDVLINAAENDVDDTPDAAGIWNSAHITGNKLQNEAGVDVVPQPDITVTREG